MNPKRSSKEIIFTILKNISKRNGKGIARSRLSSISYLTHSKAKDYYKFLFKNKLIEERDTTKEHDQRAKKNIFITPIGKELLLKCEGIISNLNELDNELLKC